jgi:hypothetical protein
LVRIGHFYFGKKRTFLLWLDTEGFFLLTFNSFFYTFILPKSDSHPLFLLFIMKLTSLLSILLLVLTGGCASGLETSVKDIDWRSRIGTYTYEQALLELGEPNVLGESSEGRTAEWVLRRSPAFTFGFGLGTGNYGNHTSTGVGVGTSVSPPPSGEYLHLRFDKDDKLAEWSKVKY